MDFKAEIARAERRIRAGGHTVKAWCRGAGIPLTTWYRWRNGDVPDVVRWNRVSQLVAQLPIVTEQKVGE